LRGEELAEEILKLSELGTDELRERWKAICGKAPSREIGRSFLIRAIAYRLQERTNGGLKPSTCRLLARAIEETATESSTHWVPGFRAGDRCLASSPFAETR
jgi:hypothetical protein